MPFTFEIEDENIDYLKNVLHFNYCLTVTGEYLNKILTKRVDLLAAVIDGTIGDRDFRTDLINAICMDLIGKNGLEKKTKIVWKFIKK